MFVFMHAQPPHLLPEASAAWVELNREVRVHHCVVCMRGVSVCACVCVCVCVCVVFCPFKCEYRKTNV